MKNKNKMGSIGLLSVFVALSLLAVVAVVPSVSASNFGHGGFSSSNRAISLGHGDFTYSNRAIILGGHGGFGYSGYRHVLGHSGLGHGFVHKGFGHRLGHGGFGHRGHGHCGSNGGGDFRVLCVPHNSD